MYVHISSDADFIYKRCTGRKHVAESKAKLFCVYSYIVLHF